MDLIDEATRWLRGDCWDAVMNYLFTRICFAYFIGDGIDKDEYARTSFHKIDPIGARPSAVMSRNCSRIIIPTRRP